MTPSSELLEIFFDGKRFRCVTVNSHVGGRLGRFGLLFIWKTLFILIFWDDFEKLFLGEQSAVEGPTTNRVRELTKHGLREHEIPKGGNLSTPGIAIRFLTGKPSVY